MSEYSHYRTRTGNNLRNERGSTTTTLLLVLLLVIAAGGYLYYFTDLIRPAAKEAPKPQSAQNLQVKQPIPPRPQPEPAGMPVQGGAAKPAVNPSPAQPATVAAQKPVPPATSAAVPAVKPEVPKGAGPQPQPAQVQASVPPPAQQKSAAAPAAPAKKEVAQQKPAAVPAKKEVAQQKPVAAPAPQAKKEAASARPAPEQKVAKRKQGAYAILVGDFVPDKTFETVQVKLKKTGVSPIRKHVITAAEPMNRLYISKFDDQDSAEAELHKLKTITADAFLVAENGKYSLYAGSYYSEARKQSELKRLSAKGIAVVVKPVHLPIKVTRVTAGSYASADEAANASKQFKKMGLTPKVVKIGS